MNDTAVHSAAAELGIPGVLIRVPGVESFDYTTASGAALAYLFDVDAGEVAPTRIAAVKWEAGRRIEAAGFTAVNQANWSRYATRLLRKQVNGGALTADEQADAAFAEAGAQWIDAVRAASDAIEATEGLSPFDPAAPWPAMPDPASYRACPKVF